MNYMVPIGLQPNGGYLYRCPDCRGIWPSDRGNIETFRCCDNEPLDLLGTLADYLGCTTDRVARREHERFCADMVADLEYALESARDEVAKSAIGRAIERWKRVAVQWPIVRNSNLRAP